MTTPADLWKVSNFEQRLISMQEHFDTFLEKYDRENPLVFRDRIMREQYPLFSGLTQKTNIWHPGLGPQAGISDWNDIQISTVGAGNDGGYNACTINPQTYGFSIESKEYTGKNTEWRSPVICVKDTMWTDEARQQVGYIYSMGIWITSSAWEVYTREMYMKFASDADNLYVLTEGDLFADNPKFTYDPFTTYTRTTSFGATEKFTVLKVDPAVQMSTLNMSFMDLFHAYLGDEAPGAALSSTGGFPTFGLMLHLHDFERMFRDDPELRQDMRYAQPQMLFENYTQTFKTLRGWGMIHDRAQMRFKFWKIGDDGKCWFRRVLPLREGRTLTVGKLPEANTEYHTAEVAVGVVFLKDVFKIRIPPKVDSLGGGSSFGPAPGFSGDWQWINYPSDSNPLREIGYHYMRMAAFPAPLQYSTRALAFAYRRCPQTWGTLCSVGSATEATTTEEVAVAVAAVSADIDTTLQTITLKLAKRLPTGINGAVILTDKDNNEYDATLVADANAPYYTFVLDDTEWASHSAAAQTAAAWTTAATVENNE